MKLQRHPNEIATSPISGRPTTHAIGCPIGYDANRPAPAAQWEGIGHNRIPTRQQRRNAEPCDIVCTAMRTANVGARANCARPNAGDRKQSEEHDRRRPKRSDIRPTNGASIARQAAKQSKLPAQGNRIRRTRAISPLPAELMMTNAVWLTVIIR
jgi:hypothetical protein